MKSNYIIHLSDHEASLEMVGGKGASLARLSSAGLPVPGGFCVTTAAYRQFVAENGLQSEILQALEKVNLERPSTLEEASCHIHARFSAAQIASDIVRAIVDAYSSLPDQNSAVAVRSSATAEDLPEASFAGQQETYLNISGAEAVLEAIKKCWASLWTARAIGYRLRQGIPQESVALAVVVQLMAPAEVSGILFTVNPVIGDRSQALISASWGLGQAVVGGLVTPDSISVDKNSGRVLERITADKQVTTVLKKSSTEEQAVPENLRRAPVLTDSEAAELTRLGVEIEKMYGTPMDIEWALYGGMFTILQARPITALPVKAVSQEAVDKKPSVGTGNEWNDSATGDYLWSNVNFGEAISDVMTPLTWSVVQFILNDWVYVPGMLMVGNIGGRPYLNISVLATLFHRMGKSRQDLLSTLEGTLYMQLPEEMTIPYISLSRGTLVRSLLNAMRIERKQRQGVKGLDAYVEANLAWFRRVRDRIRAAERGSDLITIWQNEMAPHIKQGVWCVLGSVAHSANYTLKLRRELVKLVGADDADALISNLGDESGPLASMEPMIGLARVARGEMSREDYLEQYGHRGPNEFELSNPHPAEDPEWFDHELENYRKSPIDISALLQTQREKFDLAWDRFQSRYPRKAKAIRRRIAESARRARLRELARSAYVRDRWAVRLFALRAGELSGLGHDVFFLTLEEVLNLLAGNKTPLNSVQTRKEIYQRYKSLPPYPSVIRGRFDPFEWAADPQRRSDIFDGQTAHLPVTLERGALKIITGSPGSAGQVEGTARVLASPEEGSQLQPGEILVAVQTDIAWTLLFPRAAAVVTDVGAPLSHAAIVARELGIPAVVGCGNATQRLKTGDRVRVDGGRGIVKILKTSLEGSYK